MNTIKYIDRETGIEKFETPPGVGFLKFLYHNPFGGLALHTVAKRKLLTSVYGNGMNSASSCKRIKPFVEELDIDMSESLKSMEEFTSFNDFFYRELKPGARAIEEGLVSPGDGKVLAFEKISDVHEFFVKGRKFTLDAFLKDRKLAEKYQHGSMFIIRLAPNDYHRFHFPYSGIPAAPVRINGHYYSVSPYALYANFTKVFCENKREYTILTTADRGEIIVSPVGATMVGTIIETYENNQAVEKGDEMGYFAFGGSTVVVLVEEGKVEMSTDILDNTRKGLETSIKMGEQIAR